MLARFTELETIIGDNAPAFLRSSSDRRRRMSEAEFAVLLCEYTTLSFELNTEGCDDCPICYQQLADGSRSVVKTACGHDICLPCFRRMSDEQCQFCRVNLFDTGESEPAPEAPAAQIALPQQPAHQIFEGESGPQYPAPTVQIPGMPDIRNLCAVRAIWDALLGLPQRADLTTNDILTALMEIHLELPNPHQFPLQAGFWSDHIQRFFDRLGVPYSILTRDQWIANRDNLAGATIIMNTGNHWRLTLNMDPRRLQPGTTLIAVNVEPATLQLLEPAAGAAGPVAQTPVAAAGLGQLPSADVVAAAVVAAAAAAAAPATADTAAGASHIPCSIRSVACLPYHPCNFHACPSSIIHCHACILCCFVDLISPSITRTASSRFIFL
jgi:hypothetical protein